MWCARFSLVRPCSIVVMLWGERWAVEDRLYLLKSHGFCESQPLEASLPQSGFPVFLQLLRDFARNVFHLCIPYEVALQASAICLALEYFGHKLLQQPRCHLPPQMRRRLHLRSDQA